MSVLRTTVTQDHRPEFTGENRRRHFLCLVRHWRRQLWPTREWWWIFRDLGKGKAQLTKLTSRVERKRHLTWKRDVQNEEVNFDWIWRDWVIRVGTFTVHECPSEFTGNQKKVTPPILVCLYGFREKLFWNDLTQTFFFKIPSQSSFERRNCMD